MIYFTWIGKSTCYFTKIIIFNVDATFDSNLFTMKHVPKYYLKRDIQPNDLNNTLIIEHHLGFKNIVPEMQGLSVTVSVEWNDTQ